MQTVYLSTFIISPFEKLILGKELDIYAENVCLSHSIILLWLHVLFIHENEAFSIEIWSIDLSTIKVKAITVFQLHIPYGKHIWNIKMK